MYRATPRGNGAFRWTTKPPGQAHTHAAGYQCQRKRPIRHCLFRTGSQQQSQDGTQHAKRPGRGD